MFLKTFVFFQPWPTWPTQGQYCSAALLVFVFCKSEYRFLPLTTLQEPVERVPEYVSSELQGLDFVQPNHLWTVGEDGVILYSGDRGSTWGPQVPPVEAVGTHFYDVRCAKMLVLFVILVP